MTIEQATDKIYELTHGLVTRDVCRQIAVALLATSPPRGRPGDTAKFHRKRYDGEPPKEED
jgi:hypothetical protein